MPGKEPPLENPRFTSNSTRRLIVVKLLKDLPADDLAEAVLQGFAGLMPSDVATVAWLVEQGERGRDQWVSAFAVNGWMLGDNADEPERYREALCWEVPGLACWLLGQPWRVIFANQQMLGRLLDETGCPRDLAVSVVCDHPELSLTELEGVLRSLGRAELERSAPGADLLTRVVR